MLLVQSAHSVRPPQASDIVVTLIARRATARAGTRHWRRGVDSYGNAANFVESEMITELPSMGVTHAFVQVGWIICAAASRTPSTQ